MVKNIHSYKHRAKDKCNAQKLNAIFWKTMENVRKHDNQSKAELFGVRTKLLYNKNFSGNLLSIEMKRTQIIMKKTVYLGLSIFKIRKLVMHEFWCDYVKPKCGEKPKLCYMDTNIFMFYTKTEDIYIDNDVKRDLILQVMN